VPNSELTHSLGDAAARIPCSVVWLRRQLAAGRFTGRKIAGQWRLTDDDIAAIVDACATGARPAASSAAPGRRAIPRRITGRRSA
jgi:hypothetical protein